MGTAEVDGEEEEGEEAVDNLILWLEPLLQMLLLLPPPPPLLLLLLLLLLVLLTLVLLASLAVQSSISGLK